jgi:hypothetical protein
MRDAKVTAWDGATDTVLIAYGDPDRVDAGVDEQRGTFQITTEKSGYEPSVTTITADRSDGCHVITEDAQIKLAPL